MPARQPTKADSLSKPESGPGPGKSRRGVHPLERAVIHRRFSAPLYGADVNVLFTDSTTAGARWIAEKYPREGIDPDDYSDACAFVFCVGRWPWVILPWDASIDTISHEAVHAAYEYNNAVGVKSGYTNQESLAYLVGYMTEKLANMLADVNLERAKHFATLRAETARVSAVLPAALAAATKGGPKLGPGTRGVKKRVGSSGV